MSNQLSCVRLRECVQAQFLLLSLALCGSRGELPAWGQLPAWRASRVPNRLQSRSLPGPAYLASASPFVLVPCRAPCQGSGLSLLCRRWPWRSKVCCQALRGAIAGSSSTPSTLQPSLPALRHAGRAAAFLQLLTQPWCPWPPPPSFSAADQKVTWGLVSGLGRSAFIVGRARAWQRRGGPAIATRGKVSDAAPYTPSSPLGPFRMQGQNYGTPVQVSSGSTVTLDWTGAARPPAPCRLCCARATAGMPLQGQHTRLATELPSSSPACACPWPLPPACRPGGARGVEAPL